MIKLQRADLVNEMVVIAMPIPSSIDHEYQYQVRWIGGPVYYRRRKGEMQWHFTTELDFAENVKSDNLIDWSDPSKK